MKQVVIVGAGQGGLQVAVSLRQDGFDGRIVLIGDEPGLPYQRPPLSKAYMKDGDASRLALKPDSFFVQADVDYRPGQHVARIDREGGAVMLDHGEAIAFDHLVLATGATNLRPPLPGLDLPGVHALRDLHDAMHLRRAMGTARRAVVIGGGFIGLEFASVARAAGLAVTVIEAADRLMARAVTLPISRRFLDAHTASGTDVQLATAGRAVTGIDRAEGVELADGRTVAADLVLLAVGVRPNIQLAADAGLATENGVQVDGHLRTDDPRIFAIGDCANFPLNGARVRLESVQAAADHARHVAKHIMGAQQPHYAAVPWFWSDQGPLKLQIAGLSSGFDDTAVLTDPDGAVDTVFAFAQDALISVETVNQAGRHMAARKLLARGAPITRHALDAAGWDLKQML